MANDWTEGEVQAAVDAYFEMLRQHLASRPFNKAEVNRTVRAGPLSARSRGSVEFKFGNVSAVLRDEGLPWIPGYKPYPNAQRSLREAVVRAAVSAGLGASGIAEDRQTTTDPEVLRTRSRRLQRRLAKPPDGTKTPERRHATGRDEIARSPEVVAWVLLRSNGNCELCREPAPFVDRHGDPFLEVHHVKHLADGGSDTPGNAVALCPNCHRELHYGKTAERLKASLFRLVSELQPE